MPNTLNRGLYAIRNTVSGKTYYGSTDSFPARWRQHRTDLRGGRHGNQHLQHAWARYGESAFVFSVLCVLEADELKPSETRLLAAVVGRPDCYNIARDATACMRGLRHTPEARAKIAQAGRDRPYNPETFRKVAEKLRGRPLTAEHREKLAAAKRGKKQSPETIAKRMAQAKGRKHTAESRAKMSAAVRGKKRTPEVCERMSLARKGKPLNLTPEAREARRAHLRAVNANRSPESIARQRESRKGWKPSAESRERMRLAHLGKTLGKRSPETIARMTEAQRRRRMVELTAFGERKSRSEWAQDSRCAVDLDTFLKRLRVGWPTERAITEPARDPRNNLRTHRVTAFGETKALAAWAADVRSAVGDHCIKKRLRRGWRPERAITEPARITVRRKQNVA